jgi:hypothetical protein
MDRNTQHDVEDLFSNVQCLVHMTSGYVEVVMVLQSLQQ